MKFTTLFLLTLLTVGLGSGCASLTHDSRYQYLLVQSEPPGAQIYVREKLVGTTPAYVEVRRRMSPEVTLKSGEDVRTVGVETKYDWRNTFWPNFVLLVYAPVGWGIDFLTGSAWKMKDPAPQTFEEGQRAEARRLTKIAIAPPLAPYRTSADGAGDVWYRKIVQENPSARVLTYEETLAEFTSHGFDFDRRPNYDEERKIFGRLGVDKVFESSVTETKTGVELRGHYRDVYSNEKQGERVLAVAPEKDRENDGSWFEKWKDYYSIFPNTLGFEWAASDVKIDSGTTYKSQTSSASGFGNNVLTFMSAIDLRHLDSPRRSAASRFRFSFAPALRFSNRYLEFPDFRPFGSTKFHYTVIEGGYGPEIGWQSGAHYLYIDFVPVLGWYRLAWGTENDGSKQALSRFGTTWRAELGYLYFLTQSFSIRLFSMATSDPAALWNSALEKVAPGTPALASATYASFGLTFSYTFEPARNFQAWRVFERSQKR